MDSAEGAIARLRGCLVGSLSGAVSVAAHGLGGGGMAPDANSVALLLVACAAVGALTAELRADRHATAVLIGTLAAGQLIGHLTLVLSSPHAHGLGVSPQMAAAHGAAIGVTAALARVTERALMMVLAVLMRVVLAVLRVLRIEVPVWAGAPVYRARLSLWLLITASAGTRGPPALA